MEWDWKHAYLALQDQGTWVEHLDRFEEASSSAIDAVMYAMRRRGKSNGQVDDGQGTNVGEHSNARLVCDTFLPVSSEQYLARGRPSK